MTLRRAHLVPALLAAGLGASGCVTIAEHRKLERRVMQMQGTAGPGGRVADLGTQLSALDQRLSELEGRLDEVQHDADRALEEAKRARTEAAGGVPPLGPDGSVPSDAPEIAAAPPSAPTAPNAPSASREAESTPPGTTAQEVAEYREAHAAWRSGDLQGCIDRFRTFLQTHPASPYADDAAYWMAECHFKQGDYKSAILRFDDVVARYPEGDKSADALYRQGEALLKLGPGYAKAASKAFERVMREYPGSPRAEEAKRQLDLLGPG
jgi:tol-pal system protein YbgF